MKVIQCAAAVLTAMVGGLASTASLGNEVFDGSLFGFKGDKYQAHNTLDNTWVGTVDLASLLDPKNRRHALREALAKQQGQLTSAPQTSQTDEGREIDLAFEAFYDPGYGSDPANNKLRRNRVQERMLAASAAQCGEYKTLLNAKSAKFNFWSGLIATVSGTAGAVVRSIEHSRTLSALAAASTGIRAEYNQDFLANLTAHVIAKGIDLRREEIYKQILDFGQKLSIEDYPVEHAVKDAITYHESCSLVVGLQVVAAAVRTYSEPRLDAALEVYAKTQTFRALTFDGTRTPEEQQAILKQYKTLRTELFAGTKNESEETKPTSAVASYANLMVTLTGDRKLAEDGLARLTGTAAAAATDLKTEITKAFTTALLTKLKATCEAKAQDLDLAVATTAAAKGAASANTAPAAKLEHDKAVLRVNYLHGQFKQRQARATAARKTIETQAAAVDLADAAKLTALKTEITKLLAELALPDIAQECTAAT